MHALALAASQEDDEEIGAVVGGALADADDGSTGAGSGGGSSGGSSEGGTGGAGGAVGGGGAAAATTQAVAFTAYKPRHVHFGCPHPDPIVETAALSAVDPPPITARLSLPRFVVERGLLSRVQLEAVLYASMRHEQLGEADTSAVRLLAGGSAPGAQRRSGAAAGAKGRLSAHVDGALMRLGFFIGDGAGVGKGREVAGIIFNNWMQGRRRALWFSVSADLKVDAERDLADIGADGVPVHALNKLKYGRLDSKAAANITEGVVFSTYSSLIAKQAGRAQSRLQQLVAW